MIPPADLFHALSSEVRLLILRLLAAQDGKLSVEVLTDRINAEGWHLKQSSVSFHLRILKQAGLITCPRRGLRHFYVVEPRAFAPVTAWLTALTREEAPV